MNYPKPPTREFIRLVKSGVFSPNEYHLFLEDKQALENFRGSK